MAFEQLETYSSPSDYYRELTQATLDSIWEISSAKTPENGGGIYEQDAIGSDVYNCIDAWTSSAVESTAKGTTDARDFLCLNFKSINHRTCRGLYYRYDGNYWICNSYNEFNGLQQDCNIRRCNNKLKIIDPFNGSVYSIYCAIEYNVMSPALQVNRYLNTPNSHIIAYVQANEYTMRLFSLNKRFIINGHPFKIFARQDMLDNDIAIGSPTFMSLDLYLDEAHNGDDLVNGVADNGEYEYSVAINAKDAGLVVGSTGNLTATVTLNGEKATRAVKWSTSNKSAVTIDSNGNFSVVGSVGQDADITVRLIGNEDVFDKIKITIVSQASVVPNVIIEPAFDSIRQYEHTIFNVQAEYSGSIYTTSLVTNVEYTSNNIQINSLGNNKYEIIGIKPNNVAIPVTFTATNTSPAFSATKTINIKSLSMMG